MSLGRFKSGAAQSSARDVTRLATGLIADFIDMVKFANKHAALHQLVNSSGDPETFYGNLSNKGITESLCAMLIDLVPNLLPPSVEINEYLEEVGNTAFEETLATYHDLNSSIEDAAVRGEQLESYMVMNLKRIKVGLESIAKHQKQLNFLDSKKGSSFYFPKNSQLTDDNLNWLKSDFDAQFWLGQFESNIMQPTTVLEPVEQD